MKYISIVTYVMSLLAYISLNAQGLQKPGGIDEYWSTVPVNSSTTGLLDGLVPTERTRLLGIGTDYLDGNAKLTVFGDGLSLNSNILSIQTSNNPSGFGILSHVDSENSKAFSSNLGNCETFHILGSGHLESKSLKIFENGWCDYVFNDDYRLMPLQDLKNFIISRKHLPEIKRETEVNETGVNVYEMNKLLLKKIEELTLYVIAKQEELNLIRQKQKID